MADFLLCKASFILHCMCVALSFSGCFSISAPTTVMLYCINLTGECSVLCWVAVENDQYISNKLHCCEVWIKLNSGLVLRINSFDSNRFDGHNSSVFNAILFILSSFSDPIIAPVKVKKFQITEQDLPATTYDME